MSPADFDEYGIGFLEELLAASPEVREAVAGYMDRAFQRGVRVGHRAEHERLSRLIGGITAKEDRT